MVLVIIGHCTYFGIQSPYGGIDYDSGDYISPVYKLLCFAVQFIYSFHMPLFMFASGMCFCLVKERSVSFGSFAMKKAKRLLVPFVLTTTFISVPLKYIAGYWSGSDCPMSAIFLGQYLAMGNTHLWFVMALFDIMVIAYFIERWHIGKSNILFWLVLLVVSWGAVKAGSLSPWANFLCLARALHFLLFFELGVFCLPYAKRWNINSFALTVSFVAMAVCYCVWRSAHLDGLPVVHCLPDTVFAVWGIFNMVFLAKKVFSSTMLADNILYAKVSQHSYGLYLYSDPFNYALIALMANVWGTAVFASNALSLIAFSARLIGTPLFAFLVIGIVGIVKSKVIGK